MRVFTGIIEETGTVRETSLSPGRPGVLSVTASMVLEGTRIGDSIAVSGVCQTVVGMDEASFTVDVMPETAKRSTLGEIRPGTPVNLERALRMGDRIGGHIVNGHVDAVGQVRERRTEENAVVLEIALGEGLTRYIAPKGSVAVDGVSLTVVGSGRGAFSVSIIPHTLEETTLKGAKPGTRVNIEVDVIAKYIEALMRGADTRGAQPPGGLEESLLRGGFLVPGEP